MSFIGAKEPRTKIQEPKNQGMAKRQGTKDGHAWSLAFSISLVLGSSVLGI
jgi:hypothetical protein